MTRVDLQTRTSKTTTFDGSGVAISSYAEAIVKIRINSLTAAKKVAFMLADSVDSFSNQKNHVIWEFKGAVPADGVVRSIHSREIPGWRLGVGSATTRLSIIDIDSGATVSYEAWLEVIA